MPPSMKLSIPIGHLFEEAQEANNKIFKNTTVAFVHVQPTMKIQCTFC